jgi:hypothetical protein
MVGFAYSVIDGPKLACMVYDAVMPEYRGRGNSKQAYEKEGRLARETQDKERVCARHKPGNNKDT